MPTGHTTERKNPETCQVHQADAFLALVDLAMLGLELDSMILKFCSNLNKSVIFWSSEGVPVHSRGVGN